MAKLWIRENVQRSNGFFLLSCLALIISLISSTTWAAEKPYPNRPINMVIAYAPGGSADLCSKPVADRMAEFLGQPMISVYKPGGGGSLGAACCSQSEAGWVYGFAGQLYPTGDLPDGEKNGLCFGRLLLNRYFWQRAAVAGGEGRCPLENAEGLC